MRPFDARFLLFAGLIAAVGILAPIGSALAADSDTPTVSPPETPAVAPVPDAAAINQATQLAHQLFKDDIDAAKTQPAKLDLAKKLLAQALDTKGDPAGKFVLLHMAQEYATAAVDPGVALRAIDEMSRSFQVDSLTLKLEAFTALAKLTLPPSQAKAFVDAAATAIDEAIAADNFDVAKQLATVGVAVAKRTKDPEMNKLMVSRSKDIDDLQAAFAGVNQALGVLDKQPLDPSANLAVGKFRALVKGDWDNGIPLLALGSDADLKAAAVEELTAADGTPDDQLKLADDWWKLAGASEPGMKDRIEARAVFWYTKVDPQLAGLVKLRVDKRLQEVVGRVFARVQTAVKGKKLNATSAAGAVGRGGSFVDLLDEGALLVGFEVGATHFNGDTIKSLRPIYLSGHGEVNGGTHGSNRQADVLTLKARDGYAVAGVTFKGTNRFEAMSVTFMQIQGQNLNPRTAYTSNWVGSPDAAGEVRLGGSGALVAGIKGTADNSLQSVSLITVR